MQKLVTINPTSNYEVSKFNESLDKGWCVIKIKKINNLNTIFIIEKHTRKEKLDNLNNLQEPN